MSSDPIVRFQLFKIHTLIKHGVLWKGCFSYSNFSKMRLSNNLVSNFYWFTSLGLII